MGNSMPKLKLFRLTLLAGLCFSLCPRVMDCFAQGAQEAESPPRSARLPGAFSRFSAAQALKQIFPDYDPRTGRATCIPDSLGRIAQAQLSQAEGEGRMIVSGGIG